MALGYFGTLRGFKAHKESLGGVFSDDSAPAAMAWLVADFSQKKSAFKVEAAREVMRMIGGAFFVGGTFIRTTGLWKGDMSGGLALLTFRPFYDGYDREKLAAFQELARGAAKHIAMVFDQDAVSCVVQAPDGTIRIEFVGQGAPVNPFGEIDRSIKEDKDNYPTASDKEEAKLKARATLARAYKMARANRLTNVKIVYGD